VHSSVDSPSCGSLHSLCLAHKQTHVYNYCTLWAGSSSLCIAHWPVAGSLMSSCSWF